MQKKATQKKKFNMGMVLHNQVTVDNGIESLVSVLTL